MHMPVHANRTSRAMQPPRRVARGGHHLTFSKPPTYTDGTGDGIERVGQDALVLLHIHPLSPPHSCPGHNLPTYHTQVTIKAKFVEDLGLDSLDAVELVMAFEDEFGQSVCRSPSAPAPARWTRPEHQPLPPINMRLPPPFSPLPPTPPPPAPPLQAWRSRMLMRTTLPLRQMPSSTLLRSCSETGRLLAWRE